MSISFGLRVKYEMSLGPQMMAWTTGGGVITIMNLPSNAGDAGPAVLAGQFPNVAFAQASQLLCFLAAVAKKPARGQARLGVPPGLAVIGV